MQFRRYLVRTVSAARIIGPLLVAGSLVASVSTALSAVYTPQQALPSAAIQEFLGNPGSLLTQYPNGGPQLTKAVRDLAASDPQTLSAIIGLLKTASPDQASAIGTGLGQVAELAVNSDPDYANQIQTAVVSASSDSALVAFSAVVGGDIKLAAATGGAGVGGGGEAATGPNTVGGGISGSSPLNFPSFVVNTADTFSNIAFSPGTPGTPSVSPTTP
jgi:hypothetical protein